MCVYFCGKAYSVGDGFCYEGIIHDESSSDKYHFVIDCGNKVPTCRNKWKTKLSSKSDCETRIEEITDEIASKCNHINLFIMTHFHEDHYSGYEKLFNKTDIDTIIMPYLYPEERLCLIINRDDLSDDDAVFLANPYKTIMNLSEEKNSNVKLILIRGNESLDSINQDDTNSSENNMWGVRHPEAENILELEELKASQVQVIRALSSRISIPNFVWELKFYNLEVDETKIDQLKKIIGGLTAQKLFSIVTDKILKNSIKKQYSMIAQSLFNDINNTSIVIYHAPYNNERYGTLITGDISLKNNIANDVLNYFKAEIDKVSLFSIPHHGSDKNWNGAFIKGGELDNSIGFTFTHNYYTNRLTTKMMSDFRCQNISVLVVDENRLSEFEHIIEVYNKFCQYHIVRKNNHKLIEFYV